MRSGLAATALAVPLGSCSEGVTDPSGLVAGTWRLRQMRVSGEAPFVPDDPSRFTVEFAADGRIGIVADCNQCGGTYTLDDGTLEVSDLACTLALCAAPGGEQFTRLLDGRSAVEGGGDELEVASADGVLLLTR